MKQISVQAQAVLVAITIFVGSNVIALLNVGIDNIPLSEMGVLGVLGVLSITATVAAIPAFLFYKSKTKG